MELARTCDAAVVFVGLPAAWEQEAFDRPSFALPEAQVRLLRAVAAARPDTVVAPAAGPACDLEPWHEETGAILLTGLAGQGSGWATAQLLFGRLAPRGRLAETWPRSYRDTRLPGLPRPRRPLPLHRGGVRRIPVVRRARHRPPYCFGHGLTWMPMTVEGLEVRAEETDVVARVRVRVRNATSSAGGDVVQVYLGPGAPGGGGPDEEAGVRGRCPDQEEKPVHPVRRLVGFARVEVGAGREGEVDLALTGRDLSWWDPSAGAWRPMPGPLRIEVGFSSRDIRASADLEGQEPVRGRDRSSFRRPPSRE